MSTRDTQMNQYLTTIAEAVHGRDMRSAIHDGLEKTYNDAYTWFNESLGNANQALQKATEALDIAEPMGDDIQEIKDLAEDLDTRYDETNERVNNIIAHNQDTQGNSELIDLRTTYDGQIKTSAGTAVRSQISNLHSRINNLVREQSTGELEDCHAKPVYVPLYENQYPSSAFAAQTLQLSLPGSPAPSLAKYAFIKITFKDSNLFGAGVRSVYIPNPGKDAEATNIYTSDGHVTMPADGTYGINSYSRKFTAALSSNDTVLNIMFTDCEKIATDNPFAIDNSDMTISDPSSTTTTDNEYLIPYEVFLIDYVLDGEIEIDKDTELIDIRNGEDGTTYQSAGAAVRGQIVSAKNKTASTQSMIAPLYSVSGTYAAGDYVNYTDKLYKAKQAISSESWTPSHWQEVNVIDEVDSGVGELKSALTRLADQTNDYNTLNIIKYLGTFESTTVNGITFTWDADTETFSVSGTATARARYNFYINTDSIPSLFKKGKRYLVTTSVVGSDIKFLVIFREPPEYDTVNQISSPTIVTIPDNLSGVYVRVQVENGKTVNGTISNIGMYQINDGIPMDNVVTVKKDGSGDFDTIRDAVESITNASKDNPYYIDVYPGQYDVMDDYSNAEIEAFASATFGGIMISDGINIRGVGDCHEVILNAYLPTTYDKMTIRNKVSTLTVGGNASIENLTLIAENVRYCVHDAYGQNVGKYKRVVKNVIMRAKTLTSGNPARTWGCGFMSTGEDSYFENVDFGMDLVIHSNTVVTEPTMTVFRNCRGGKFFFDQYHDVTNKHTIIFDSCSFEGISISEDDQEAQTVFVYGTNKKDAFIRCLYGRPYYLNAITTFPVGQVGVGTMVALNVNTVKRITDKNIAYGVIVNKDADSYYVSTSKYISTDYIGLSDVNEGDYVTVNNLGEFTIMGATSTNAVGVIVTYRTDNYVKMLY